MCISLFGEWNVNQPRARILIVDDKPSVRSVMSAVLGEIGYRVRIAKDGLSALREIRQEIPDILLSDLHMPGMSGFELLAVVRRRFPSILVIAMSGAFAGDEVPSGIPADGFFQKGCSTGALLRILTVPPEMKRHDPWHSGAASPGSIQRIPSVPSADGSTTIVCPDCRRTATQILHGVGSLVCDHCGNSIEYAINEVPAPTRPRQNRKLEAAYAQYALGIDG